MIPIMNHQTIIEQLGYSPNEAKLYLCALDLGECTVTDLANKSGMPRTSVQSLLSQMRKRGLMNNYAKKRRKYWMAESPEKLVSSLKEREIALNNLMPELQAKHHVTSSKPVIRLYHGAEEIKLITDDIIQSRRHLLGILSWDDWRDFFGNDFVNGFIDRRGRSFLNMRLLTPKTHSSITLKAHDSKELRQTKFLPLDVKIKNSNFIYGNKVAIISLNTMHGFGIVIEDIDVANTMTWMFESLWKQSEN